MRKLQLIAFLLIALLIIALFVFAPKPVHGGADGSAVLGVPTAPPS